MERDSGTQEGGSVQIVADAFKKARLPDGTAAKVGGTMREEQTVATLP